MTITPKGTQYVSFVFMGRTLYRIVREANGDNTWTIIDITEQLSSGSSSRGADR